RRRAARRTSRRRPSGVPTPARPPVARRGLPPTQSVVPVPAEQTNRPLSAGEAAQIALARQPSIAAASGQVTASRGVTQQERSGLLPTVGLTNSFTHTENLKGRGTGATIVAGGAAAPGSTDPFPT